MKKIMYLSIGVVAMVVVAIVGTSECLPYFRPAVEQTGLRLENREADDTLRVAYIGDSWAEGHIPYNQMLEKILKEKTTKGVRVRTAGISGLTSKNIYYSMFRNPAVRSVVEWHPDYCIVVAGINDSDRKMGRSYYKENMRLIVKTLLESDVVPVIVEIPSYDIEYSFKRRSRETRLAYLASMLVTFSRMNCIENYRQALVELMDEEQWHNNVLFIGYVDWNPDGYADARNLYDAGRMHLNGDGYFVLDSCIAESITNHNAGSSKNEYR